MAFPFRFDEIRNHHRPHRPVTEDRGGVIGWEDFEALDRMR